MSKTAAAKQITARKVQVGTLLDTDVGPVAVEEITHDRYNADALIFTVTVRGTKLQVGAYKPGSKVSVIA